VCKNFNLTGENACQIKIFYLYPFFDQTVWQSVPNTSTFCGKTPTKPRFSVNLKPASDAPAQPIEVRAVIEKYFRRWPWYLVSLGLAALGAVLYLRYTPPEYRISATLLIKDEENGALGTEPDLLLTDLGLPPRSRVLDNEIQILKSRQLMTRVVQRLGLTTVYFVKGRVRENVVYRTAPFRLTARQLRSNAYDRDFRIAGGNADFLFSEKKTGFQLRSAYGKPFTTPFGQFVVTTGGPWRRKAPGSEVFVRFEPLRAVVDDCLDRLSVKPAVKNSTSTTVEIAYTDAETERGLDVVDRLIAAYNQAGLTDKNTAATHTLAFIDERLTNLGTQLARTEGEVERFKRARRLTDLPAETELMLHTGSTDEKTLAETQAQVALLDSLAAYLRGPRHAADLVPTALGLPDPTLLVLTERYNDLHLQRERLLHTAPASHPLVTGLDRQLATLRGRLLESLGHVRRGLLATVERLRRSQARVTSRAATLPGTERELGEISRQQRIQSDLYVYLLQKREEVGLSLSMNVPDGRLIDAPTASLLPVGPKTWKVALVALALAVLTPTVLIALHDALDDTVHSEETLRRLTDVPVLGSLARHHGRAETVFENGGYGPVPEQFRLLRSNLSRFAPPDNASPGRVLLVTSAAGGEGKSFVSINLALAFARTGLRTALIDADLRRAGLSGRLTPGYDHTGLSEFLTLSLAPDHLPQPTTLHPNLAFVPSGLGVPNPTESLVGPRLETLFAFLETHFDRVVIDTPPAGLVADARALAPFVVRTLWVVRAARTRRPALRLLDDCGLPNPVAVLNDVRGRREGYGYYDAPRRPYVRVYGQPA
jgi:capsular exopolysaccharide synthesis family protein